MSKTKIKDSTAVTIRMDNEILNKLKRFCDGSGQSKTVAIERAVNEYVTTHESVIKEFVDKENK